jgi:hypothetical protein
VAFGTLLIVMSVACSRALPGQVEAAQPDLGPEETVEAFYEWYSHYPGNPLVDGALRTHTGVTEGLVEKVYGIVDSFDDKGGYDPVLCAQDVPSSFEAEVNDQSEDSASTSVSTSFEGHQIFVGLQRVGGVWMIADITCP